jgi:hypothetical protein
MLLMLSARCSMAAAACATSSSDWMRTFMRMRVTSIFTTSSICEKSSNASRLYSCFGFFCA